jgi:hypothetical protein
MSLLVCLQLPYLFEGKRQSPKAIFQFLPLQGLLDALAEHLVETELIKGSLSPLSQQDLTDELKRRSVRLR